MVYRVTAQAVADLDEIHDFIARRSDHPEAAATVEDYLFEAFERIGRDPAGCGGKLRPHITAKPYKILFVRKYAIINDDLPSPPLILAVAGNRRDLSALLNDDFRFPAESGD